MQPDDSVNSSANFGTPARHTCTCCHQRDLVKPHYDHPDILLCDPCRAIIFTLEANGDLAHLAYAYWINIIQAREL